MSLWAVAGISAAQSLFSSYQSNKAANRQAQYQNAAEQRAFANQAAQTAYSSEIEKLQIADYNAQTVDDYGTMIDQYNQQIQLNRTAATGALAAEQWKLNEQFAKAAFTRNELQRELALVEGEQRARGMGTSTSKSRARADMLNSLAEYGRSAKALELTQLSARTQAKTRFGAIAGKQYQSDLSAYSKIQIPPRMRTPRTGGGPNLQSPIARQSVAALSFADVGTAALAGAGAGWSAKAGNAAPGELKW
tara:strand:+ start:2099 stop:2845 length:747 start_codon:yes stop_codon:yes gene_type:complete